jgi:hypothetical protein
MPMMPAVSSRRARRTSMSVRDWAQRWRLTAPHRRCPQREAGRRLPPWVARPTPEEGRAGARRTQPTTLRSPLRELLGLLPRPSFGRRSRLRRQRGRHPPYVPGRPTRIISASTGRLGRPGLWAQHGMDGGSVTVPPTWAQVPSTRWISARRTLHPSPIACCRGESWILANGRDGDSPSFG